MAPVNLSVGRDEGVQGQIVRRLALVVGIERQNVLRLVARKHDRAADNLPLHGMQGEIESGDDAEVAAAAAHAPEQLGILVRVSRAGSHLSAVTISTARTLSSARPKRRASAPETAAEREPAHAGVRYRAAVVTSPCAIASWSTSPSRLPPATRAMRRLRVDSDAAQQREIDLHAAFARGLAGRTVAAALHCEEQVRRARELHRTAHVGRAARLHDQRRVLVDLRVPDAAGLLVGGNARQQQVAAEAIGELLHAGTRQRYGPAIAGDRIDVGIDGIRGAQERRPGATDRGGQSQQGSAGNEAATSQQGDLPLYLVIIIRSCRPRRYSIRKVRHAY